MPHTPDPLHTPPDAERFEQINAGSACDRCQHNFDDHVLMAGATYGPLGGGMMFCPVEDCECESTWGPNSVVPTEETKAEVRAAWASFNAEL